MIASWGRTDQSGSDTIFSDYNGIEKSFSHDLFKLNWNVENGNGVRWGIPLSNKVLCGKNRFSLNTKQIDHVQ